MTPEKKKALKDGKANRLDRMRADGITPKQEKAILALLHEPTIPKAAKVCGLGERTIHRWLTEPEFTAAYRRARREAFGHSIALAQQYAPLAVNTLIKAMTDPESPYHSRVTAASTLLKFGREGIELDDLAARVEALEQAAKQGSGSNGSSSWRYAFNGSHNN